jgi:hypothetical protein
MDNYNLGARARIVRNTGGIGRPKAEGAPVAITRSCGHVETISIYGDPATSTYYANQQARACRACWGAEAVAKDTAAVTAGRRIALESKSESQGAWAQRIRQGRAEKFVAYLRDVIELAATEMRAGRLQKADSEAAIADIKAALNDLFLGSVDFDPEEFGQWSGHARWWIDARELTEVAILALLMPDRDVMRMRGKDVDLRGVFARVEIPAPAPTQWDVEEAAMAAKPAFDAGFEVDDNPF